MTSRREFLKKAGLLTAAFTVPSLNTQGGTTQSRLSLKNTKIAVDDRWDVIVVGGGPGGCAAVRFLMVRKSFIEVWQRKSLKLREKEYRMRENRK